MTCKTTVPQSAEVRAAAEAAAVRAASRRAERYVARHFLWEDCSLQRVRYCGRFARSVNGVGVRVAAGSGGFSGLQHCGSVWACPVCSAKIAAGRQAEIAAALTEWQRRGGRIALATLTMRHAQGHALADLWDAVGDAWNAATSGAGWKADQLLYGVPMTRLVATGKRAGETVTVPRIRTIRVIEVTHGQAGWHVHVHALLLLAGDADDGQAGKVARSMFLRWSRVVAGAGFGVPSDRHGFDVRILEGAPADALGDYFTKAVYAAPADKAALEVARGDLKDAKAGNRTPFAILRGLVTTGEEGAVILSAAEAAQDRAIWAEWEKGSKGRRQMTWTTGLRAELLPDVEEQTDEELADAEVEGEEVALIEPAVWSAITRARADWAVLQAFIGSVADGLALVEVFRRRAEVSEARRLVGVSRVDLPRPDWRRRP